MPYLKEMDSPIHSIIQDKDGDIFIGTEDKGLYVYTADWKLKKHFLPDSSDNPEKLPISTISILLVPMNTVYVFIIRKTKHSDASTPVTRASTTTPYAILFHSAKIRY